MKFLNVLVISCALLSPNVASATIIDNGTYTTIDGIDWLDLSETRILILSEALENNPGWQLATKSQFINMFAHFETYGDGLFDGEASTETLSSNGNWTGHSLAVLDNTIDNLFSNLFGITGGSIWRGYIISRGWFADGDMIGSGGLTEKDDSAQTGYSINEDFTSISMNVHNIDYARHGTFLVRNVPQVPEPSTIILICLGIIGFVTTQRNKFIVKA